MTKNLNRRRRALIASIAMLCACGAYLEPAHAASASAQIQTSGAGLVSKVAPGEFLPLSVKLLNFGNKNKVDVTVSYEIADARGKAIYGAKETVAVETTANFIKTIQIPFDAAPGRYTAKSFIVYPDQASPAATEFPFVVERKIFGLFESEFYLYGGFVLLTSIATGIASHLWIKRRRATRLVTMDYPDIPRAERIFYEILSDTIMQMRSRVGDEALYIAENIDGLKIDGKNGRILALTERPSKVIAALISEYEKLLGKKVSISFRKEEKDL